MGDPAGEVDMALLAYDRLTRSTPRQRVRMSETGPVKRTGGLAPDSSLDLTRSPGSGQNLHYTCKYHFLRQLRVPLTPEQREVYIDFVEMLMRYDVDTRNIILSRLKKALGLDK